MRQKMQEKGKMMQKLREKDKERNGDDGEAKARCDER